jgi:hypothetical protein
MLLFVVFEMSSLLIIREVKNFNLELTDSVTNSRGFLWSSKFSLTKYFHCYREYHSRHGMNIILTLNISSYVAATMLALSLAF